MWRSLTAAIRTGSCGHFIFCKFRNSKNDFVENLIDERVDLKVNDDWGEEEALRASKMCYFSVQKYISNF